jgi:hypothetical protein
MTVQLISHKHYVAGWLDSSIHDFLSVLSPKSASTKYALITCLDSNRIPASLRDKSPELKSIASKTAVLGTGLLVCTERLVGADSEKQIFFGFDEVWFFPSKSIAPKPESVSLVGPARLDQGRLKRIGKWMSDNSCSMGLGGGEGLNFVVQARGLVRYLLGHSIEQPQPSFPAFETADSR